MTEASVLVDLTRAWQGTAARVMTELDTALRAEAVFSGRILVTPAQADELSRGPWGEPAHWETEVLALALLPTDEQVRQRSLAALKASVEAGVYTTFFSFNTALLNEVARAFPQRNQVNPRRLAEVAAASTGPAAPGAAAAWDDTLMPADEMAGLVALATLRAGGQLKQTQLRDLLARLDDRLAKRPGSVAAVPGFISRAVRTAVDAGLVSVVGEHPSVQIQVTDAGRAAARARESGRTGRASMVRGRAGSPSRSGEFVAILREAELGPYMPYRWAVYEALGPDGIRGVPFGEAIRAAVAEVREGAGPASGGRAAIYPWSRLRSLIETLMRRAEVALDGEGLPLTISWRGRRQLVQGMAENWQAKMDAVLLVELARSAGPLTHDDVPDIAGALYGERTDATFDRVYDLVDEAVRAGVVVLDDEDRVHIATGREAPGLAS